MTRKAAPRPPGRSKEATTGFVRELGLLDSTMIVAGSMIGSGIFIVPAEIARQVGSAGWLLMVWVVTGLLTVAAALSYGELAAMMPKAGGQYVYLREAYSPLWGFLYGWTLFLVIQTGTIAAVAVGFARFLGVLAPGASPPTTGSSPPIDLSAKYAVSLSAQQLVGILLIVFLTWLNTRGIRLGKVIQNTFTSAKTLSLIALIVLGILVGRNAAAIAANFSRPLDAPRRHHDHAGLRHRRADRGHGRRLRPVHRLLRRPGGLALLLGRLEQHHLHGRRGEGPEAEHPAVARRRHRPGDRPLHPGQRGLPVHPDARTQIQTAPDDRVATAALQAIFGPAGAAIMAVAIIISTFGCNNGLILAGARVYYAMAQRRPVLPRDRPAQRAARAGRRASSSSASGPRCWCCRAPARPDADGRRDLRQPLQRPARLRGLRGADLLRADHRRAVRAAAQAAGRGAPVPGLRLSAWCRRSTSLAASRSRSCCWSTRPRPALPGLVIVLTGIPVYFAWRRKSS